MRLQQASHISLQKLRPIFLEAKYSRKKAGAQLYSNLVKKAENVKWGGRNRKEHYVLVSKSGFAKDVKDEDVLCLNMNDINRMIYGPGKR